MTDPRDSDWRAPIVFIDDGKAKAKIVPMRFPYYPATELQTYDAGAMIGGVPNALWLTTP